MLVSILIIAVSLVLFLYWFRYSCVLILNTRTTRDYSAEVAQTNQLCFVDVREILDDARTTDLDAVQQCLEKDYELVSSLMKQAGDLQVGGSTLEEAMLRIDFRLMKIAYGIAKKFSDEKSRSALDEMSLIVAHFANSFGERAAGSARA